MKDLVSVSFSFSGCVGGDQDRAQRNHGQVLLKAESFPGLVVLQCPSVMHGTSRLARVNR